MEFDGGDLSGGAPETEADAPGGGHQRARGALDLGFKRRDGATVLGTLRQEGCLKARFPRPGRGAWAGAVTLNTAGGVAGGDRLDTRIAAAPGTAVTVAAQAAERFYRAIPGSVAAIETALEVGAGAALEWLPQAAILFDGCAARRRLTVDVAADGWFLGVEQLVFGRTAMGERVERALFADTIALRRAGRLVWRDAVRFAGPVRAVLDRAAGAGGGRAVATILLAAGDGDAGRGVAGLRAALRDFEAGVSAWDGVMVARIVADDGACLRAAVVAGLAALRGGRDLPRVWEC